MAIATNTKLSFSNPRNREEFSDAIYRITPEETPFLGMIGKEKVESIHPEWQTDVLATPNAANAQLQGDDFSYTALTDTNRVGTYTQISRKEWIVARTAEKTLKAGPQSELGRQRRKKGIELRKDIEAVVLSNQASTAGNATTAPKTGGLPAWLVSNVDRGATGANGGFSGGVVTAATNGTQRAFSLAILRNIIIQAYTNGGSPKMLMLSPYAKTVFSGFMSDPSVAPQRMTTSASKQAAIVGAADSYLSDFGLIDVVPNRVMGTAAALARNVFLIDPDMVSLGEFDPIKEITPAVTGDATKKVLITEYCLKVNNEAGLAVAADIYGLNAAA